MLFKYHLTFKVLCMLSFKYNLQWQCIPIYIYFFIYICIYTNMKKCLQEYIVIVNFILNSTNQKRWMLNIYIHHTIPHNEQCIHLHIYFLINIVSYFYNGANLLNSSSLIGSMSVGECWLVCLNNGRTHNKMSSGRLLTTPPLRMFDRKHK